jgi:carbon-monoxide dehydrogenase medium subunit
MLHPDYSAPATVEELLSALRQSAGEAKLVAGGTDLIPRMRSGQQAPKTLIDLRRLPLRYVEEDGNETRLGALATHTQLSQSRQLKSRYPALVSACQQVGAPPVRNRGTLGGNLANASPAADTAPPLLVYDAQVCLAGLDGDRWMNLEDFFLGPGQTALQSNEFVREIRIPMPPARTAAHFIKLGKRQAMAIAVVGVAVRLSLDETGIVSQARIALGSVAPTPRRAAAAEAVLQSNRLGIDTIRDAARAAREAASPISDLRASAEYRRQMVEVLVGRALTLAQAQLSEGNPDE